MDRDASSRSEQSGHLDVLRIHQTDQVLHDDVHAILMEIAMVAEAEQIELEALALDHADIRDILDAYLGEIRLPGDRTETREFRTVETHPVVILLMLVHKRLQHLRSIVTLVFSLSSEALEPLRFTSWHIQKLKFRK